MSLHLKNRLACRVLVLGLALICASLRADPAPGSVDQALTEARTILDQANAEAAVTVAVAESLRRAQVALKAAIEALPEPERVAWLAPFDQYVTDSDRVIATKPLSVNPDADGGILVRSHTDLMTRLGQLYNLMDTSDGEVDFSRLAGVEPADLVGLDTFAQHLAARSIGPVYDLPSFDLYSPLGHLQLLDRLVRKYAVAGITRLVGPSEELDADAFLRCVDGTKAVFDRAVAAAVRAFGQNPVTLPSDPLTLAEVRRVLAEAEALNRALAEDVRDVLAGFTGEDVFRARLEADLASVVNYGGSGISGYASTWSRVTDALSRSGIVYELGGRNVRVSGWELDQFAGRLPYDAATLFRYPGIAADLTPEAFGEVISNEYYNRLGYIDLSRAWDGASSPTVALSPAPTDGAGVFFSPPARRFQVPQTLIAAWVAEVVAADATVLWDVLRARMLLDAGIEADLAWADGFVAVQADALRAWARQGALTEADYQAMKELLLVTRRQLADRFRPRLDGVVYDTWNEVTSRLDQRYQALVAEFTAILGQATGRAMTADESLIEFDPARLERTVLQVALDAIALRDWNGQFNRSAYLRLNLLDEAALADLRSPEALDALRRFDFGEPPEDGAPRFLAAEELRFRLIARLVAVCGTADPRALLARLTSGVPLPVALGQSLEGTIKAMVQRVAAQALASMDGLPTRTVPDLLALRDGYQHLTARLRDELLLYRDGLTVEERDRLENWINWDWQASANLRAVRQRFDERLAAVDWLAVEGVRVPVRQILGIERFPWSRAFDAELFVGLGPADFAEAETWSEANQYRDFHFDVPRDEWNDTLTTLGRCQVVDQVVRRLLAGHVSEPLTSLEAEAVFFWQEGVRQVDPEAFRLFVKGVNAMLTQIEAKARARCQETAAAIRAAAGDEMTIEQIMALYQDQVLSLRQELLELLAVVAAKHERRDVMRAENPVSLIFQQEVFAGFTGVVHATRLVTMLGDGQTVGVPVLAITNALLEHLRARFGPSVAAHHFASFYGITLDRVRGLHKLEDYLGEQVVALPSTSEYVQIVSQISELGYMQLASWLVQRYGPEILDPTGGVDAARLIEWLTARDPALTEVRQQADKLVQACLAEMGRLPDPLTFDDLQTLKRIVDDTGAALVSLMNDFLSGLRTDDLAALRAELETLINGLIAGVRSSRDQLLAERQVQVTVETPDAKLVVSFGLGEATVGRFIAFVARYVAEHPAPVNATPGTGQAVELDGAPIASVAKDVGLAIWSPIPPADWEPGDHPTRFGMAILFTRLVVKYGEFVVVAEPTGGGRLDLDLFEAELLASAESRARRRLDRILETELPAVQDWLSGLRTAAGVLPVAQVPAINARFTQLRDRISALAGDAFGRASEVWAAFIKLYESSLFSGRFSLETEDGQTIEFEPDVLDARLMDLYRRGRVDPAFFGQFVAMIEAGETTWEYDWFRYLYQRWPWYDGGYGTTGSGARFTSMPDSTTPAAAAGEFTLGDLARLPGIQTQDLAGLDVAEKQYLKLTLADPAKLLGLLNLRALAPGSGAKAGGLINGGAGAAPAENGDALARPVDNGALEWRSYRFKAFSLLPAMITAMGNRVLDEQRTVVPQRFALLLEGRDPDAPGAGDETVGLVVDVNGSAAADGCGVVQVEKQGPTSFRLIATPLPGYVFAGWVGDTDTLDDPDSPSTVANVAGGAQLTARFTRANAPPVANPDQARTFEETAVAIPVLANDSDPEEDALTPVVVLAPAAGVAVVNPDGTITYTPEPGFTGTDSFSYKARDAQAESVAAAVVEIVVVPFWRYPVTLHPEWNLVSVPVELLDPTPAAALAPALILTPAWGWSSDGYVAADRLEAGCGYWVCVRLPGTATAGSVQAEFCGRQLAKPLAHLTLGWNLVCPLAEFPVAPLPFLSVPFWTWDPVAQVWQAVGVGEVLRPTVAYWVYAFEPGELDLAPSP